MYIIKKIYKNTYSPNHAKKNICVCFSPQANRKKLFFSFTRAANVNTNLVKLVTRIDTLYNFYMICRVKNPCIIFV